MDIVVEKFVYNNLEVCQIIINKFTENEVLYKLKAKFFDTFILERNFSDMITYPIHFKNFCENTY